jgi:hypothetical protein
LRLPTVVAFIAGPAVLTACGSDSTSAASRSPAQIDERAGTFRGVGLDDTNAAVKRVMGRPAPFHGDLSPVGHNFYDDGAPVAVRKPPQPRHDGALRYRAASFDVADGRVYGVEVVERGAHTLSGDRIGESLRAARKRHPALRCSTAHFGSDFPTFPYCTGKIAPRVYIWIGQDPVASISLARHPFIE